MMLMTNPLLELARPVIRDTDGCVPKQFLIVLKP